MTIYNYEYLENLSEEDFKALRRFFGYRVGSGMTAGEFCRALDKMPRTKKGVLIQTTCGKERVVLTSQPVKSIYLDGKLIYQSCKESVNDDI